MRIDLEHMKNIFHVFLESETAHVTTRDLEKQGVVVRLEDGGIDERFLFTLQLCIDNQLIGSEKGQIFTLKDAGIIGTLGGDYAIAAIPLRLTQKGHDFAYVLENNEVLERLKTEFKNAPFKVVFNIGQQLLTKYAEKKLGQLEI
jgi:hypothetical protein